MDNNAVDIHEDSGRYLQEYVQSKWICFLFYSIVNHLTVRTIGLENLPSEIQYHWAEIKNRNDQAKGIYLIYSNTLPLPTKYSHV